jgi:hypothetical protein
MTPNIQRKYDTFNKPSNLLGMASMIENLRNFEINW